MRPHKVIHRPAGSGRSDKIKRSGLYVGTYQAGHDLYEASDVIDKAVSNSTPLTGLPWLSYPVRSRPVYSKLKNNVL